MLSGQEGILMEVARGEQLGVLAEGDVRRGGTNERFFYNQAVLTAASGTAGFDPRPARTHADDPELQRGLAKLSIIDALIGQLDRHFKNVYVAVNPAGQVTRVSGIDNDLAFPTQGFQVRGITNKYQGLPPYMDRELAEMILVVSEADFRAVLDGLLTPQEIDAAVERLRDVKTYLQGLKANNMLLDPGAWTPAMAGQQVAPIYHFRP